MKWLLIAIFPFFVIVSAQEVLWDDVNITHSSDEWEVVVDSLRNHGIRVYNLSDFGWQILENVSVLWIQGPDYFYPDSVKEKIISFSRRGGKVLIGIDGVQNYGVDYSDIFADLFSFDDFAVSIELDGIGPPYPAEGFPGHFSVLHPYTDGIDSLHFWATNWELRILGDNTIPFVFMRSYIVGAINFPFKNEGDCENYIVIFTGMHTFETTPIIRGEQTPTPGDWELLINIFRSLGENYDFEIPCDSIPFVGLPDSLKQKDYECTVVPNPFTPNGDKINDYCQFSFSGIMFHSGRIMIYDVHSVPVCKIDVPLGWGAKTAARWDGTDSSGEPAPQGLYLYVIESDGEVVCEGTVTLAR